MLKRQYHTQAKQGRVKSFPSSRGLGYRLVDAKFFSHMRHWTRTTPWRDHELVQGQNSAHLVSIITSV